MKTATVMEHDMTEGYPHGLVLQSPHWPGSSESEIPGNENNYVPQGFVLGGPAVIFPYRDMPAEDYYGAQAIGGDPIRDAPLQSGSGGTVYFETKTREDLETLLKFIGVMTENTTYVAIAFKALDPVHERYLDQMRILTHSALKYLFRIETDELEAQSLTIKEAVTGFVEAQDDKWNEPGGLYSPKLHGTAGGDGDWARESLAFGFHVENSYWGVYRLWSRSFLITK